LAKECRIDPAEFSNDIKKYFDRRALADALKSTNADEPAGSCGVSKKSLDFLKGHKPHQ
jgi:hypothetical protein